MILTSSPEYRLLRALADAARVRIGELASPGLGLDAWSLAVEAGMLAPKEATLRRKRFIEGDSEDEFLGYVLDLRAYGYLFFVPNDGGPFYLMPTLTGLEVVGASAGPKLRVSVAMRDMWAARRHIRRNWYGTLRTKTDIR